MSDPVRGTLTWRNGRPLVTFPTRKGTSIPTPVSDGHLARELVKPQTNPQEVDLELEAGRPHRIRPIGAAWTEAAPADPPALPQQGRNNGRRNDQRGPGRMFGREQHQGARPPHRDQRPGGPEGPAWQPAFHNPYGFVRTPERDKDHPELGDLGDERKLPSHSWYDHGKWSGRVRVELTVETPLLLPDAAEVKEDSKRHKTYPVRLGPDDRPYLPPTSVKGMLRSAYEAVTNSRLGVFTGHNRRLGFRMAATEGLAMVPGRVVGHQIELLMGTNPEPPREGANGRWQVPRGTMYAAWLPAYRQPEHFNICYPDRKFPEHGDEVRFWGELIRHRSGRFSFWEVRRIARAGEQLPAKPQPRAGGEVREFRGWVCITNQNINRKHDERVFFHDPAGAREHSHPLEQEWTEAWGDLIAEYQDLHKDEIARRNKNKHRPEEYLGHQPGSTAFSRHVYRPEYRKLRDGALVYVRLDGSRKPVALYPVMIARELHPDAPEQLLDSSLHPAASFAELSPADRVFGWVNPKGTGAYRGNLRVGPVQCDRHDAVQRFGAPLPLAILGQPKPNQARFYLSAANGAALHELPVHGAYRAGTNRLHGRKHYPHHAHLERAHWDDAEQDSTRQARPNSTFQEYRRTGSEKDDQNRSVEGWVKRGTKFSFDVFVTNLSQVEIGALLWLLNLGLDGNRPRFLRLGGGKPLGFGSVRLAVTGHELATGTELAEHYTEFDLGPLPAGKLDPEAAVTAFKDAVRDVYGHGKEFEQVSFIADFLTAAEGFSNRLPIHYPRVTAHPSLEGENFKWFQENDRGHRVGLAPLSDSEGLPRYSENQYRR